MRTVVDASGRPWSIDLTIGACERLRSLGVDLFAPEGVDLAALVSDVPRWTVSLYVIVQPEASARCIGPEAFADGADGEFLDRAAHAFAAGVRELSRLAPDHGGDGKPPTSEEAWQAVYEMAGLVGVDPAGLTPGELARMAHGRRLHDWDITSAGMALLANCNRDPKARSKAFEPTDFHPFRRAKRAEPVKMTKEQTLARLKAIYVAFGGKVPSGGKR
ncbi:MAG: hypothetical protein IT450_17935 [Phycisphaerales bacterium]|nr:hypothetical protein [Phycisphaerales bacterium]